MLTADLVRPRVQGGALIVEPLAGKRRDRARELAAAILDLYGAHVGATRGALAEAIDAIPHTAGERVLFRGLVKLVDDGANFEDAPAIDPVALRWSLFARAAAARQGAAAAFDRAVIVDAEARARGIACADVEAALWADLPDAHVLRGAPPLEADALVARYDEARAQAVLLRATRVTVDVQCAQATTLRALFRKLKFLQLLWTCERLPDAATWRLVVDGPLALFQAGTRYGLKLALLLPALQACDRYALVADVRWGKDRVARTFAKIGGAGAAAAASIPDEVRALLEDLRAAGDRYDVDDAPEIIELPGKGVVVPDLALVDRATGEIVYVELLGHWSRDAVWRRVDLVGDGLAARVVFCASEKLRVDERALDADAPSCLYVYKGRPSAKRLLEKVAGLAGR